MKRYLAFFLLVIISTVTVATAARSMTRSAMHVNLVTSYMRPISVGGSSELAAMASAGGKFLPWLGADFFFTQMVRSRDCMFGVDLVATPIPWLFFRAGYGAYNESEAVALKGAFDSGIGMKLRFGAGIYALAEMNYKMLGMKNYISPGVGLGVAF